VFTTLTTPPGKYLFTLALSNDLHFGEGDSGIIENNWPPSFMQDPGLPPYPTVMLQAMLGDLRQPDRKADRPLARAWGQRTRGEYYSLYPHYMLGTIADRNHTVVRDLSGLTTLG
jgi:hypothetical protein